MTPLVLLVALANPPALVSPAGPDEIVLDAFFDDWTGRPVFALDRLVEGDLAGPDDLSGTVQIAYDRTRLLVAAQIRDDLFRAGTARSGDGLELVFAGRGVHSARTPARFRVVLGDLAGRPPTLLRDGKPYGAGKVVGTPRKDGWAVELSLRLADIPGIEAGDVPFAALVRDVDHDGSAVAAVVTTAPVDRKRLPTVATLRLDTTTGLYAMYARERGATSRVMQRLNANVAGSALEEQVVINDLDIVVLGTGLPGDAVYLYFTHGWPTDARLERADLMDLDGRPGRELLVGHSEWQIPGEVQATILEIYGVRDGYFKRMFAAKLSESRPAKKAALRSRFKVLPRRGKRGARRLQVTPAEATGVDPFHYVPVDAAGEVPYEPLVLPWETKKPVNYALDGDVWLRE